MFAEYCSFPAGSYIFPDVQKVRNGRKVLFHETCETLNTALVAGIVYEPLIIRYGIHSGKWTLVKALDEK
jgi:hypothetical protein